MVVAREARRDEGRRSLNRQSRRVQLVQRRMFSLFSIRYGQRRRVSRWSSGSSRFFALLSAPKADLAELALNSKDAITILALHGEPLFFQHFDGPYYPTLRILHRCEPLSLFFPRRRADLALSQIPTSSPESESTEELSSSSSLVPTSCGASVLLPSPHLLSFSSSFPRPLPSFSNRPPPSSPGLTSPTAYLPETANNIPAGTPVAVHAYGKENALAIGLTAMSTDDIRSINKNMGVETVTYLGDDLWGLEKL